MLPDDEEDKRVDHEISSLFIGRSNSYLAVLPKFKTPFSLILFIRFDL